MLCKQGCNDERQILTRGFTNNGTMDPQKPDRNERRLLQFGKILMQSLDVVRFIDDNKGRALSQRFTLHFSERKQQNKSEVKRLQLSQKIAETT